MIGVEDVQNDSEPSGGSHSAFNVFCAANPILKLKKKNPNPRQCSLTSHIIHTFQMLLL